MRSLYLAFLLATSPAICVGEIVSFEWDGVSDDRVSHYQLGVGSVSGVYYPSNEVSAPQTTTTVDLSEESFVAVRSRGFFSDEPESPEDPIPDPTWHVSVWSNEVVWAATLPITQPGDQIGLYAFIEESTEMALSATPDFWWKLDETSGTAVANSGGYGTPSDYDGVLTQVTSGSYSWIDDKSWGSGGVVGAVDLAPSGSTTGYSVLLDNTLPLAGETKITLAFWIRDETGGSDDGRIFYQGNTWNEVGHQYMVGKTGTTDLRARINGATYADNGDEVSQDTDMHIVAVLDFSASPEFSMYKNGSTTAFYTSNLPEEAIDADSGYSTYNGLKTYIGSSSNGAGTAGANFFSGLIGDVRIWLDAATTAEVEDIYDNTLGGGGSITVTPAALNIAHNVDLPTLTQATSITGVAINQAHNVAIPTLIQANTMTPIGLEQAHNIESSTLAQSVSLSSATINQTHNVDAPTLGQAHSMSPVGMGQAHNVTTAVLAQANIMAPVGLDQAHNVDTSVLTQGAELNSTSISQAHNVDVPDLTQDHIMAPASMDQSHDVDTPTLDQANIMAPLGMDQSHDVSVPTLGQAHVMGPTDLGQSHSVDVSVLTQAHIMTPIDLDQDHNLDEAPLTLAGVITPTGLVQLHDLADPILYQANSIVSTTLNQANNVASPVLTQASILVPVALLTSHNLDQPVITAALLPLQPDGLANASSLSESSLSQAHVLFVDELSNIQYIDVASFFSGFYYIDTGRVVMIRVSDKYVTIGGNDKYIKLASADKLVKVISADKLVTIQ